MRGWLALALSASVTGWWLVQWLLDQPLEPARTGLVAVAVAVIAGHLGWMNVRRRLRQGLAQTSPPTPRVVYETRADGGSRRIRFSGAVFLTAMIVLVFDTLANWYGISAGVVAGGALAVGLADLWESRLWRRAERERGSELYLLVNPNALVATYGEPHVYEVSPEVGARAREDSGFAP
jgi:4-amino-4-deoxy-L-arabinose transferase-like glycosyltransferase